MISTTSKGFRIAAGIIAANVFGVIAFALFSGLVVLAKEYEWAAPIVAITAYPSIALVPMGMGVVAAYFWEKIPLSIGGYFLWWLAASFVAPLGAAVFWHEGAVCLLIAAPLLYVCGAAGVFIGRIWFKARPSKLNLTIVPLLVLAILGEARLRRDSEAVVTDRLIVRASAAEVWKHVVEFPPITTTPDYWLNRIGLPSPSSTTCEGDFVGAHRRCIFSNGLVFEETVTEIVSEKLLTFDIVEQPPDPELLGHLDLHRGQFELKENGDGTTTLIGRSWYTLHVRPLWYFDWWTRDITSRVHLRVMEHIKRLSEQRP